MSNVRQLISVCAMLIATIYYFFGKPETANLPLEPSTTLSE